MNDTVDLLQIKIEKAKTQLSDDTLNAIAAVPWQAIILGMRETKGYSFEQLGDLEIETELLLCGLLNSEDYPRELESRMKISKAQVNELVQEMNSLVFSKIREELIKNTERKKMFAKNSPSPELPLKRGGGKQIETINKPDLTIPELKAGDKQEKPASTQGGTEIHPLLVKKMSGPFQIPSVKTEHSLDNITKTNIPAGTGGSNSPNVKMNKPAMDPYRELPE
jgi:hypothetical protein